MLAGIIVIILHVSVQVCMYPSHLLLELLLAHASNEQLTAS